MPLKNTGAYTQTNDYILSCDLPYILGGVNYPGLEKDIDAERLATEDASYVRSVKKTSGEPLAGETEIRTDLEKLRDVAYRTYSDKAADCLKEAEEICENANPENFRNELSVICANRIKDCETKLEAVREKYKNAVAYEKEVQADLDAFREKNGLTDRAADITGPGKMFLCVVIMAAILFIETILNGKLFGGAVLDSVLLAAVPSLLNCFFGIFTAAMYKYTYTVGRKKVGYAGVVSGAALIVLLNLGLAHYRAAMQNIEPLRVEIDVLERKDTLTDADYRRIEELKDQTNADVVALQRFKTAPFDFDGIQSVFLFVLGVICSLLNGLDYYHWNDSYPGYGKRWKKRDEAREALIELKKEFGEEKAKCSRQTREEMKKYYDGLKSETHSPFDALIKTMTLYRKDLPRFEDDLERAGRRILSSYFRKFAETAPDFVPDRAAKPYELPRERQEDVIDELKRFQQKLKQSCDANRIAAVYEEEVQKTDSRYDRIIIDEAEKETL